MANLIDATYFIGEIEIANANQGEISADLLHSITLYEKEVLTDLLGYAMYKDMQAAIAAAPAIPLEAKWVALIEGEEFTYTPSNGVAVVTKWEGLKGANKKSLVAYYIYFRHRTKRQSYNAGVGIEVEAATENAINSSLYVKLTEVWNEFIAMYGTDCGDYQVPTDPTLYSYYYYEGEFIASAYNYLLSKQADFPNWKYKSQGGEINRFGL